MLQTIRLFYGNGENKSVFSIDKKIEKAKVLIPVFPGSNCDYDTARAFEEAGTEARIFVFKNLTEKDINDSINEMVELIRDSHILAFAVASAPAMNPTEAESSLRMCSITKNQIGNSNIFVE